MSEQLRDLADRLNRAHEAIGDLAATEADPSEVTRLFGKASGLHLAWGYVQEMLREEAMSR